MPDNNTLMILAGVAGVIWAVLTFGPKIVESFGTNSKPSPTNTIGESGRIANVLELIRWSDEHGNKEVARYLREHLEFFLDGQEGGGASE